MVHKSFLVLKQLAVCFPRLGILAESLQSLAVLIPNLSNPIERIRRVSESAQFLSQSIHVSMKLHVAYNSQDLLMLPNKRRVSLVPMPQKFLMRELGQSSKAKGDLDHLVHPQQLGSTD